MGKKSGSGSGMNNQDHNSESLETILLGLKYLNSLMRIREPEWKKFGSGIWDKHPGSATLGYKYFNKTAVLRIRWLAESPAAPR
jgi:hypothetical protein